jgi:hypothetical protein
MEPDIEAWEAHVELEERGDFRGLVELCKREVASNPEDLHAVERLGNAFIKAGRYLEAIGAVEPIHRREPDIDALQHIILDALFAMDLTEDDFEWSRRPAVLRLGPELADRCHQYLRPKRKPRSVGELYSMFMIECYTAFSEEDLLKFLREDPRFSVDSDDCLSAKDATA